MPRGLGLTRVGIVEDHRLFAEALEVALSLEGFRVHRLGSEGDVTQARLHSSLVRLRPEVVLLDLDLGATGDGMRLVGPLTATGIAVVVVTGNDQAARWGECLHLGARVVLPKSMPLNTIIAAIRRVASGQPAISREERERLLAEFRREQRELQGLRERLALLTTREDEVLGQLREGRTVTEIARLACVSEGTVRSQVRSILAKLQVSSQLAAVGAARRAAWGQPVSAR